MSRKSSASLSTSRQGQSARLAKARATTPRDRTKTFQSYRTPIDLLRAVVARFGPIVFDLAASDGEEVTPLVAHFTPEQNSLVQPWPVARTTNGVLWLNPPYSDIAPWAAKCAAWALVASPGPVLCFLVPYSCDSNWWADSVRGKAYTIALASRPTFQGEKNGYPKPMALVVYDPRYPVTFAESLWNWKGNKR